MGFKDFTIHTQNIRSLCLENKDLELIDHKRKIILKTESDLIIVTETCCSSLKWSKANQRNAKFNYGDYNSFIIDNHHRGIIVLLQKSCSLKAKNIVVVIPDVLRLDLSNGVNFITVFAVYSTSSYDDEDFFLALRAATLETDNTDVIIVGDLNTTLSRHS